MLGEFYRILGNLILNEYFKNVGCLLVLSHNFTYQGPIPIINLEIKNDTVDFNNIFHNYGCQGIVIQTPNPLNIFEEFEARIRYGMERFNRRRYLILSSDNTFQKNFFSIEELHFVSDLLIVIVESKLAEDSYIFNLTTHKYVGTSDQNTPILIDKWFSRNESFLFGQNLYPDKLLNQQGRNLKMATFTYEPYSIIGDSIDNYHGSELMSAVQYALKYNMTPVPVVNAEDYWGEIFPNWSGNGLLGNLATDKADIGFSALYTWAVEYQYLDLSKPLVRTGITCLVPAPHLAPGWLTPIYSYSSELWLYTGIILLTAIIILSLIQHCYNRNRFLTMAYQVRRTVSYMTILGSASLTVGKVILLQSLTKREIPFEIIRKFLLSLILVLSLFLSSTYSSGLSSIMTIPRYDEAINTVVQFASSGINWGATQDAWITSIEGANEENYINIVTRFHPISEEALREHSKTDQFAFSIERLPMEDYAIGSYIHRDVIGNFHLMEEDLYWEQCVIMMRKNSVLLPSLDLYILRIHQAGIISYWQNKAVILLMDSNVQRAVRYYKHHSADHGIVKLRWTHVEGAFAVLLFGYCISCICLVFEILIQRTKEVTSKEQHKLPFLT